MLKVDKEIETSGLRNAAELICIAARTAPKGKGMDLLVTALLDGEEKAKLAERMREIADRDGVAFFLRDAANVDACGVVILLGSRKQPLGLPHCGYCGFPDCGALKASGGFCSFNTGDLGIAVGSAVSRAADLRIDNRVMYSAGKAAIELNMLGKDVPLVYAIPLSVTSKSPFFDR